MNVCLEGLFNVLIDLVKKKDRDQAKFLLNDMVLKPLKQAKAREVKGGAEEQAETLRELLDFFCIKE